MTSGRNHPWEPTAEWRSSRDRANAREEWPNDVAKPDRPDQPKYVAQTWPWPLPIGSRTHGLPPTSAHQPRQRGPPSELVSSHQVQDTCAVCDGLEQVLCHHICALTGRQPMCTDGRHECGVDHQLGTTKQRQTISNHLEAAPVLPDHSEVQITDEDVRETQAPASRQNPGCTLHGRNHALQEHLPSHTLNGRRGDSRSKRKRKPEPAKQKHPER